MVFYSCGHPCNSILQQETYSSFYSLPHTPDINRPESGGFGRFTDALPARLEAGTTELASGRRLAPNGNGDSPTRRTEGVVLETRC